MLHIQNQAQVNNFIKQKRQRGNSLRQLSQNTFLTAKQQMYPPSVLPPMIYRPFNLSGKVGSNFTASAKFVSGAVATKDT